MENKDARGADGLVPHTSKLIKHIGRVGRLGEGALSMSRRWLLTHGMPYAWSVAMTSPRLRHNPSVHLDTSSMWNVSLRAPPS